MPGPYLKSDSGLGDVLGAGARDSQPRVIESSLLEDESPALGETNVHRPAVVGSCGTESVSGSRLLTVTHPP